MTGGGRIEGRLGIPRGGMNFSNFNNFNNFRRSPRANDSRLSGPRPRFSDENTEEELASRAIQIQTKRFYIDVKQNRKGKFIKIAEVNQGGQKKRLILSMSTAAIFRDQLSNFTDHYSTLGPKYEPLDENGTLKSEVINRDERRYYYMDLKENERGRYLRVCMTTPLSRQRYHIAIPAQGMIEIKDALTELLKEFSTEGDADEMPESRTMRVENKLFYFDVGQNKKGTFMRISEVRNSYRTSITLPESCWFRFQETFSKFTVKDEINRHERAPLHKHDMKSEDMGRRVKMENDATRCESSQSFACSTSVDYVVADDIVASEAIALVCH